MKEKKSLAVQVVDNFFFFLTSVGKEFEWEGGGEGNIYQRPSFFNIPSSLSTLWVSSALSLLSFFLALSNTSYSAFLRTIGEKRKEMKLKKRGDGLRWIEWDRRVGVGRYVALRLCIRFFLLRRKYNCMRVLTQ